MNIFSVFSFSEENVNELLIKLINTYPLYFQEPARIKNVITLFRLHESDSVTVIIETDHVDRQYRDSYYSYFSQKYSNFERNCIRLVFFEGNVSSNDFRGESVDTLEKHLIGTMVLRPLNIGNIGLTLLNPKKLKIKGYIQTCKFKLMICGRIMYIDAFPFLTQDNETMTCAETALFNLIQYYSEKYNEYRVWMPSEILNTLEEASFERVLPSRGVEDSSMAKVLQEANFHPRLYPCEEVEEFEELFYSYVESGIPLILGLPFHAVICIGHGSVDFKMQNHDLENVIQFEIIKDQNPNKCVYFVNSASLIEEYFFMDDNQVPYFLSSIDDLTEYYYQNSEKYSFTDDENEQSTFESEYGDESINEYEDIDEYDDKFEGQYEYADEAKDKMKKNYDSLLVPLYKRIFLDATRAKSIYEEYFLRNREFITNLQSAYCDETWGYSEKNPFVWRMYLTSSNSYKDFRCRTADNEEIYKYYAATSYPRFIWVLEISTICDFSEQKARVEILLDATSSRNSETWAILSVKYRNHLVFTPAILEKMVSEQESVDTALQSEKVFLTDYSSINWEDTNEEVQQKVLREIFTSLFYNPNTFVNDTFEIFSDSNLKEI